MSIIRVAPAQPQNYGDNPGSMVGCNIPIKPNDIIATRTNPNISSIFVMIFLLSPCKIKKIYGFVNPTICGQVSYSNPSFYDGNYSNFTFRSCYRRISIHSSIILWRNCRNSNYCSLQFLYRKKRTTKSKC